MECSLDIISKISLYAVILGLTACASVGIDKATTHKNLLAFERELKAKHWLAASRYALYFAGSQPSHEVAILLTQFGISTCQPTRALQWLAFAEAGRAKSLYEATINALISVERPWTRAILKESDLSAGELLTGTKEILDSEVWSDEWADIRLEGTGCSTFPVIFLAEARKKKQEEAKAGFESLMQQAPLETLELLGLAMDVGVALSTAQASHYTERFREKATHPYYQRLLAVVRGIDRGRDPKALRQKGALVQLSALQLLRTDFEPQSIELPFLLSEVRKP